MHFVHPQLKLNKIFKAKLSLIKPVNREKLTRELSVYFPNKQFVFTDMGRTAFRVIIEKMNLQNSEMLFPAYICDIFYPILKQYNIKPVFLDIDLKTFHVKSGEIRNKISPNTKSIFICHTYGLPVDIKAVREEVGDKIVIIEDCAHGFLAKKDGIFVGNRGDVSFFSLYKQLPSLRGGMLACPKDWRVVLHKTSFNFRDVLSFLNYFWPFAFLFKKFGSEYAKTHLREEKLSEPSDIIGASLSLFNDFFDDFKNPLEKRKKLALLFQQELKRLGFEIQEPVDNVFCYLSALTPQNLTEKRDLIVQGLKGHGVFCTRIWHAPIIFNPEVQREPNFNLAEFPNTVETAKRIVNFPLQNHYAEKDIMEIIEAVKKVLSRL